MVRDRKMYVAPTPFGLVSGVAHNQTLILPDGFHVPSRFKSVGRLVRRETTNLTVGYSFDLRSNVLIPRTVPNPSAGTEHVFRAWRLKGSPDDPVIVRENTPTNHGDH